MSRDTEQEQRFIEMSLFENECEKKGFAFVAGVDEAGRGPLAGPVVAGACILPKSKVFRGINDSKKLSPAQRCAFFETLTTDPDVIFGIGVASVERIDEINILEATKEAMVLAIEAMAVRPDFLLVDGLHLSYSIPCEKIIKGDSRSVSIAAASILAKEYRDRLMLELHQEFPAYGFDKHKGYGTAEHLAALRSFGPCPYHRKSFSPVKLMSGCYI